MNARHQPDERLVACESAVAHLQHDLEQLQSVVLAQRRELENLRRELQSLRARFDRDAQEDLPDALDERPPHY